MKARFSNPFVATSALTFATALLFTMAGCQPPPKKAAEIPGPKIEGDKITFPSGSPQTSSLSVQEATPRTNALTHLTGRLYWDDDVTVRVFTPVAGRVIKVLADLGDTITNGAPLAEIDSPDFGMALANARTALGNLAAADKAYSRSKELLEHGAAAQKDVEAAEAAYLAAAAEKDRAESVLGIYGGTDRETNSVYTLRSQISGVLVDKNINPGQEVRADLMLANAPALFAPLFVVSNPKKLWLQLDVSDADLPSLQPGQSLQVRSTSFPDRTFNGKIEKIGNTLDATTRSVRVRGEVENPDGLLKAEMYVMADVANNLAQDAKSGVEIPAKAVFMKDNDSYLFVEDAQGQYERKKVVVGTEKDGKVPIFQGIVSGEKVVTEGALLLQAVLEPTN